jgi:hypothetical protein
MTLVQTLVDAFAPWQSLYADSKAVASVVTAVHLVGMLFGGGLAVAADRSTLRALRREPAERARALAELRAVHRPVLVALGLLFLSGAALAAADVKTFAGSPVFVVKLTLVALLLANGAVLERTEHALQSTVMDTRHASRLWRRLRWTARLSLVLWTSTVLAGTVLVNAA